MTGKFRPQGGNEPSSEIPLNWSYMQRVFGYKLLSAIPENERESQKPTRDKLSRSKEDLLCPK